MALNPLSIGDLVASAVDDYVCVDAACTTCGAMDFRRRVDRFVAEVVGDGQQQIKPATRAEVLAASLGQWRPAEPDARWRPAVAFLLADLRRSFGADDLRGRLSGSWSGAVLADMEEAERRRRERRRMFAELNDPKRAAERRAEAAAVRASVHAVRVETARTRAEEVRRRIDRLRAAPAQDRLAAIMVSGLPMCAVPPDLIDRAAVAGSSTSDILAVLDRAGRIGRGWGAARALLNAEIERRNAASACGSDPVRRAVFPDVGTVAPGRAARSGTT